MEKLFFGLSWVFIDHDINYILLEVIVLVFGKVYLGVLKLRTDIGIWLTPVWFWGMCAQHCKWWVDLNLWKPGRVSDSKFSVSETMHLVFEKYWELTTKRWPVIRYNLISFVGKSKRKDGGSRIGTTMLSQHTKHAKWESYTQIY